MRRLIRIALLIVAVFGLSIAVSCSARNSGGTTHWSEARRDSSRQAPKVDDFDGAIIQIYAARTWGWRGTFGVHSWIATKRQGASEYWRHEVIGWGTRYGGKAVRSGPGIPDAHWYGERPQLLAEIRGAKAEPLIERIGAAIAEYPWPNRYSAWPGPNSNTFTAFVARQLPELRLDLPPTAIGKDYLGGLVTLAKSPSGTGYQLSLGGVFGILLALEEGIEINILGLICGIDFNRPALKLPGIGRIGSS